MAVEVVVEMMESGKLRHFHHLTVAIVTCRGGSYIPVLTRTIGRSFPRDREITLLRPLDSLEGWCRSTSGPGSTGGGGREVRLRLLFFDLLLHGQVLGVRRLDLPLRFLVEA